MVAEAMEREVLPPAPAKDSMDVDALVRPLVDLGTQPSSAEIVQSLQIIGTEVPLELVPADNVTIDFDVYRPNHNFSRKNPGDVAFKVVVQRFAFLSVSLVFICVFPVCVQLVLLRTRYNQLSPLPHQLEGLFQEARGAPLRLAVVHGGTATFYSLMNLPLPHVPLPGLGKNPRQSKWKREKQKNRRESKAADPSATE